MGDGIPRNDWQVMERVGWLNTRPQNTVLDDRIWGEIGILADRII